LSVFLGGTSLWKDIERRYTFSVLSLPVTRASYVLGKYLGIALFILLTTMVLGLVGCTVIGVTSTVYPSARPVAWSNLCMAIAFDGFKYCLLIGVAFLFSAVSTSFFLPIFGTISVFLAGSAIQEVHDFLLSSQGQGISPVVKKVAGFLYYLLPNLSAFNLNVNAIYGIAISRSGSALTLLYFIIYTSLLLVLSIIIYSRREMQ
jgi:Cu-processing system permease protein